MKIVCGSCSAKYSIADEKVQGKVFKIRCRKCSNVIVVKGTEDQDSGAASAASYGGTASTPEWYVVIDGEQAGPLTPEDLEGYYTSGQVSLESFIWRDGMADWTPLGQVEVFAHLAMGGGGYDEDATSLVDSSMNAVSDGYEDDATAVVDANAWQQQQERQEAEAAAAAASVGAAGYAAADFGGGYDPNDPYGDPTAANVPVDPYGSGDLYGMGGEAQAASDPYASSDYSSSDYGSSDPYAADPYATPAQADMQQGYGSLDSGFGSEPSSNLYGSGGGGYDAQASVGGDGGGLFSSFDADAGNDGGLAYQSFSGLDSLQASGVDLNSGGGASIESGMGAAAATSNGFNDANDLVGSRNENSVLFSLSSLQQVEAVKAPSDDVPLTDGSGLIDIQSLASAHQSMAGAGSGGAGPASPFDGPSSAPAVETFSPATMSVPAIMPRGSHRDNKPLIIAVVALAVLLALGGVGAAMFFATREPPAPVNTGMTEEEFIKRMEALEKSRQEAGTDKEKEALALQIAKMAEEKARLEQLANEANAGKVEEEEPAAEEKDSKTSASTKKRSGSSSSTKPSTSKDPDPPKTEKKESRKASDIDNLLKTIDNKDEPKETTKTPDPVESASSKTTKKKLSRTDVQNTVKKYNGKAKTCGKSSNAGNLTGKIMVKFNVAPSGKVDSASIKSSNFKGTDVGNCVLKVVRSMRFPAAQESTPISQYPFFI